MILFRKLDFDKVMFKQQQGAAEATLHEDKEAKGHKPPPRNIHTVKK